MVFADAVLVMIDASDPEADAQLAVTEQLMEELGAAGKPTLYVYNKCDLGIAAHPTCGKENYVFISAATGEGIDALTEKLEKLAREGKHERTFFFPPDKLGLVNTLYASAEVKSTDYREDGARVVAVCDGKTLGRLGEFIVE